MFPRSRAERYRAHAQGLHARIPPHKHTMAEALTTLNEERICMLALELERRFLMGKQNLRGRNPLVMAAEPGSIHGMA